MNPTDKARILWHCRRGMLELDLILAPFAENHLDELSEKQIRLFERLLTVSDPELYSWLMEHEKSDDDELNEMIEIINNYKPV